MSTDEPTQSILPEHDVTRFMSPEAREFFAANVVDREDPRAAFMAARADSAAPAADDEGGQE